MGNHWLKPQMQIVTRLHRVDLEIKALPGSRYPPQLSV